MKTSHHFSHCLLVVLTSIVLLNATPAFAAVRTSTATTNNWTATAAWVGGVVPAATDSVVIVSGANISTAGSRSCAGIQITGALIMASGDVLTVAGDGVTAFGWVTGVGTWTTGSATRTIALTGNWTFSGTSTGSGASVTFNGTSDQTLTGVISTAPGSLTVNKASGQLKLGANLLNAGAMTLTAGTVNPNGFKFTNTSFAFTGGTVIVDNATFTNSYAVAATTPSAGTTYQYTAASPAILNTITYQNLGFSGTGTAGAVGALTIQGNLTNTGGGTLNFGANGVTISGTAATQSVAGFTTTGTVTMSKAAGTATLTANLNAGTFVLNGSGGTFNPSSFLVTVGTLTLTNGTLQVGTPLWSGNYSINPSSVASGTTIDYINANPTINAAITFQNLDFSGSGTAGASGTLTIQGNLTNTGGGILNFGANGVTLSGIVAANSVAGFTTSGLVQMTKTAGTATFTGNVNGGGLTMNGSGGTLNLGAGLTHVFTGIWTRTNGTLNGGSSIFKIGGSVSGTGGTFTAATGTVDWNATGDQTVAGLTYNNLTLSGSGTKTLGAATTVGGTLTVSAGTTLGLSTFALGSPTSVVMDGGAAAGASITGTGALTLGGNVTINDATTGTGGATISCPVTLGGTRTFTVADDGSSAPDLTISGIMSGAVGITKSGSGTMVLSGANTFTGTTTISAGTLKLGVSSASAASGPLGTTGGGTTVTAGAALDMNGFSLTAAATEALSLSGTGVSGLGALTNSSPTASTYAGVVTFTAAASIVGEGGPIAITGTPASGTTGITLGGSTGGSVSSAIAGARTLAKEGSGTWTLSGTSTYTGVTAVNGGTLKAGVVTAAFGSGSAVSLANTGGVVLDITGFNNTIGSLTGGGSNGGTVTLGAATLTVGSNNTSPAAYAGIIGGTGSIIKSGTGTLALSGNNTFSGSLTVQNGTLSIPAVNDAGAAGPLGQSLNAVVLGASSTTAGTLEYTGGTASSSKPMNIDFGGVAQVDGSGTVLTLSGAVSQIGTGLLTKTGPGTLALGGVIDNVGLGVIANAGTVVLAKTSSSTVHAIGGGGVTIGGGTVQLGGSGGDQIYDGCTVTINTGTFDLGGLSEAITVLTGTGGSILNNGGSTGTLTINSTTTNTYSGVIANGSGGLSLVKTGSGVQTLSGTNTYTGSTTVNGGTFKAGSVQAFGVASAVTLANVAGATLDITGFNNTIGSLTGGGGTGGNVTLGAAALTIGSDNTSPAAYAGIIGGTGSLIKNGTGTLTLSGANTYTGLTTISSGTLKLGAAGGATNTPLGTTASGTTVSAGGALDLNGFTLGTAEALTLNGSGVSNGGALTNSSSTGAGYSGLMTLGSTGVAIITNAGDINITNGGTITGPTYALMLGGSGNGTLASIIGTTTGTVTKTGTGTWTLSGASTYTGLTTISAGVVKFGAHATSASAGPLGTTGNGTIVSDGAALDLAGWNEGFAEPLTLNGTGPGNGGALRNSGGADTYAGLITLGSSSSIAGSGGTIAITNAGTITGSGFGLTLGGVQGGTLTSVLGTGAGTLTKDDAGTWTLPTANTYTGGTTLKAGTLNINNANALGTAAGTFTINGGTINNTTAGTIATLNYPQVWNGNFIFTGTQALNLGTGPLTLGADCQVNVGASTLTVGGAISGSAFTLAKVGNGVLSFGSNAVSLKGLSISAGTLTATSGTMSLAGDFSNTGTFVHNSGTVTLSGSSNQNIVGASVFNNLIVNNSSGLTLGSDQTVNGTLTLTNGNISTGANKVIIAASGSVSRTSGFIAGNLQKNVATGPTSRTFEIGGGGVYAPVTVAFGNVTGTGNLVASTTAGDHPNIATSGIDAGKSVNRYYTLTNSGVAFNNYISTFNFGSGDVDAGANTANFRVKQYGGTWSSPATANPLPTSTQATNLTSFGDFAIGEAAAFYVSGNAGVAGATLNYTDGGPQSVTSDGSGNYSLAVSFNWSGTVTPVKAGYSFSPVSKSYSNVQASITGENYTATAITYAITGNVGVAGATLSYTDGSPESVTADGSGNYSLTVSYNWSGTVTPGKTGYSFTPGSKSYSNVLTNLTGENYSAALTSFTITSTAGAHGTISPLGTVSVNYGASQTFTGTPDLGYSVHFAIDGTPLSKQGRKGRGMGPVDGYTFDNVTSNHTIDATFTIDTFTLTVNAINGTVSKTPDQATYDYGTSVTLTPTGAVGYHFVSWSGDVPAGHETDSPLSVVMDQNRSVTANFAIDVFTITSTAGAHGTISPLGAVPVNYGASQTFTGTPDVGYSVHFAIDGTPLSKQGAKGRGMGPVDGYTFDNVTSNHTIDATFTIDTFTLTVNAINGTVSKTPDQATYDYGTSVTLTPTGAVGYHFVSWSGDVPAGHETDSPLSVVMDQNRSVTANFAIDVFTITSTTGAHGTISPLGAVPVNYGASQTFTGTPDVGYSVHFAIDGTPLSKQGAKGRGMGPVDGYTFDNVTSNHTIDATFTIDSFTLAVNATNGTVTKTPDQATYDYGTSVTLTPTGAVGYHFVSWSGDVPTGHETDNPLTVVMDQNRTITATFAISTYAITVSATNGTVAKVPDQVTYDYGTSVQLTATPSLGYHFVNWTGDTSGTANSVTVTMDGNKAVTANFAIDVFTITSTAGAHGTISPLGAVSVNYGASQTFTGTPDVGYSVHFAIDGTPLSKQGRKGRGMGPVDGYTFDNVTSNHTIDATFTIDTFTLAVNATNGTVSKTPDQATYDFGTSVTLTPTGAVGYHFVSWSGDVPTGHETDNPLSVAMDQNRTITATFAINTYTLTVSATNGTVAKVPDQLTYNHGTSVQLTATPSLGYHFVNWTGDTSGTANPVTVTMDGNKAVTANFAIDVFTITSTAGAHGTISPLGAVSVNYGASQTFTGTPDVGYSVHFAIDGTPLSKQGRKGRGMGPVDGYTFDNVTSNHTIDATFTIDSFTLAVNATNGTVTKTPDQATYDYGTSVTLTPTGAIGYHFVSWSGDVPTGHETDNPLSVVMDQNRTITATFAINTYTLTVSATNGTVAKVPDQLTYNHGTSVQLTATPAIGYHFVNWTGDANGTVNPVTVTMDGNKAVTANFAIDVFTITSTAGAHGTISPLGTVSVNYGASQTFTGTPDVGYSVHFVVDGTPLSKQGRKGRGMGPVDGYTFDNVTSNHTIDATFTIDTFTLTVNATNGTVSKTPDQATYDYGTSVTLTPTGSVGYHFVSWSGDVPTGHETDNPLTVVMDQNRTITATFAINTYAITVSATNGTVVKVPDQVTYDYGTSVQLTATPAIGYHFMNWTGDTSGTANPLTVTMDGNKNITANFAIDVFTITSTAGAHGTISPLGAVPVNYGASQTFTGTPDVGYSVHFAIDGTPLSKQGRKGRGMGPVDGYTFDNVTSNHTIDATFTIDTFTLVVNATNGTVSKTPDQATYDYGTSVTLTPTGAVGYHFVSWSGDVPTGHETDNPLSVAMDQNRTITATFAINTYTLTVSATNGTVAKVPDQLTYDHGTTVQLTATPAIGYHFVNWAGDANGTVNQVTMTMDGNKAVAANFAIDVFTITSTAGAHGTISPLGTVSVNYGASQTFTGTPDVGYSVHFAIDGTPLSKQGRKGSGMGPIDGYTFDNVTSNHTIDATFTIDTFTLAVNATNGIVTKTPDQVSYDYGTSVTLTPTGAVGYHFVSWSGDVPTGHETDNPLSVAMDQNRTITATFAINTYTLTVSATNGTVVKVPDQVTYDYGTSVQLTATPALGYHFVNWTGDANGTVNPVTVTMDGNKAVAANFAIDVFTITSTAGAHGTISPLGTVSVNYGASQTFTGTPDVGYSVHFAIDGTPLSKQGRKGRGMGPVDGYTFDNVTSNHTIDATFTIDTFTLAVNATNGTVTKTPDQVSYDYGTSVTLTPTGAVGYHFVSWSGDVPVGHETDNPLTVVMDQNRTIAATFAINTYTLTVSATNGTVAKVPDQLTYDHGSSVQLTATPAIGYHFVNWTGDASGTVNPVTVTMDGNKAVAANFAIDVFTITSTAGAHGTISPLGTVSVNYGASQTFTGTPDVGYSVHFAIDGTPLSKQGRKGSGMGPIDGYTFDNVTSNHTIDATFTIDTFTLAVNATNGTVTKTPDQVSYDYGTSVTLTPTGAVGYHFVSWSGDVPVGHETDNPLTVVMDQNRTITATFAINTYTLTVSATNGTVVKVPDQVTYDYGTSVQLTATANAGYHFIDWSGDASGTDNPLTVAMDGSKTITANFATTTTVPAIGAYNFDNNGDGITDMTMNYATMPLGGGTVNVSASLSRPPLPPANAIPFYLQITSTLQSYAFSATISMDMFNVTGFGPTSYLVCYNTTTASWITIGGTYLDHDGTFNNHPSFTFATDHFTSFTFVNSTIPPGNVYVAATANGTTGCTTYPNTNWGSPTGYEGTPPVDWSWTGSEPVTVFVVPESGSSFSSADVSLEWDPSVLSFQGIDFGSNGSPNGIFGSGQSYGVTASYDQGLGTNRATIHGIRTDGNNFSTASGDYIARVNFTLRKPGYSPVAVIGADLRRASPAGPVFVLANQGEVKAYLGDVASTTDMSTGDGKVDFNDLAAWSLSYWSGVEGFPGGLANYKVKYDMGPTRDGYVFSLPVPDTKINFEDLVIFAMSYGLNANNEYPKRVAPPADPTQVSLGQPVVVGGETRIPVMVGGGVADIRGMKLVINGQFGSFLGADKGSLLEQYSTPVLLMSRAQGRNVYVDFAVVGLTADGIMHGGDVVWLRFAGDTHVQINSVEGRTSSNHPINITKTRGTGESVPTTYNLVQNYPNPFNPTTTIEYETPATGLVTLEVYNVLGQRVATLMNDVQSPGFYQVVWDGRDESGKPVASGMYLYRVMAGDFSNVKKMLLVR